MSGTTHGMSRTQVYRVWAVMVRRCTKPASPDYAAYGGAGITVCPQWMTFDKFYKDMGPRPHGLTLERKNGALGYSKSNCIWATPQQQIENRAMTILITHEGKTQTAKAWATEYGVPYATLLKRHHAGWPVERVLGICK